MEEARSRFKIVPPTKKENGNVVLDGVRVAMIDHVRDRKSREHLGYDCITFYNCPNWLCDVDGTYRSIKKLVTAVRTRVKENTD